MDGARTAGHGGGAGASPSTAPTPPAIRLHGIRKGFNGVEVLHGVDFTLERGEVHALLGGNGAGKSTLMKIVEGVYTPDAGEIEIGGVAVDPRPGRSSRELGVAMIFQEFSLVPTLTVAQNIFLTRERRGRWGFLDDRAGERAAAAILDEMGVDIDPGATVGRLPTGQWQLTEIAKALSQDARVLIMDEPTASLTSSETEALFEIVSQLKARGISVIYISHRMEEIFEVADRVTVLRDGKRVATEAIRDVTMPQLIEWIVGKQVEEAFAWTPRTVDRSVAPLLVAEEVVSPPKVRGVSLELYPGEILGVAGLMGSGRSEFARALFGIDPIVSGSVRLRGRDLRVRDSTEAVAAGLALIPEDRREQGLVLDHSVAANLALPLLDRLQKRGFVDDDEIAELSHGLVDRLGIVTDSIDKRVKLLSGGNQQKVVLAKWLAADPDVLILDEPTAGVDIGAKGEIIARIRELADAGKGALVISSELPELLAVSDRIAVMRSGRIEQLLERDAVADEKQLQEILHRGSIHA